MLNTLTDIPLTLPQATGWHLVGSAAILLGLVACAAALLPAGEQLQASRAINSAAQFRDSNNAGRVAFNVAENRLGTSGKGQSMSVAKDGK